MELKIDHLSPSLFQFSLVKLQIPGGYICGKWWGPKNVRPILGIHGWLDNCGSFDRIIPLLPPEYSYLVFDLPGHGISSKYPAGMIYSYYDTVVLIERIRREYGWEKLSLMGHSLGGICGFFYAALYPSNLDLFIALDSFEPYIIEQVGLMKVNVESLLNEQDRMRDEHESEPRSYDYEELLDKVVQGSHSSVDRESAKYLLTRNMKKSTKYPKKYYFNYDRRLRGFDRVSRHVEDILHYAQHICCPILYCLGNDSYLRVLNFKNTEPVREFLLANNPDFQLKFGPGNHHFHLTHPEGYAEDIGMFIRKYRPQTAKL